MYIERERASESETESERQRASERARERARERGDHCAISSTVDLLYTSGIVI